MRQRGHIVKPGGDRHTWSIMYRDPDGLQRREGKSKNDARRRLNELVGEIDKGLYARPPSVAFEQFAGELACRASADPREHGIRIWFGHQQTARAQPRFDRSWAPSF
jgi:hypothetical protein